MAPQLNRQVIVNSFAGTTTPLQQRLIAEWLREPDNTERYYEWLEAWEQANPQFVADGEKAYRKLTQISAGQAVNSSSTEVLAKPIFLLGAQWLWLAASVLLVTSAGGWLLRNRILYQQHHTAYGEVRSIDLPDGSRVMLNANSDLRFSRWRFGTASRDVYLTGEAEFSVRHLPGHQPFIVHTPDSLSVRVLGTEFIVYSRARGSKVVLNHGRIQLNSTRRGLLAKPLLIAPGDVVTVSQQGRLAWQHHQPLPVHAAWKEHRFLFENTPVSEVTYRIAELFGVQVELADASLAHRRIGGTFRARTADELVQVISQMLEVRAVRTGEHAYRLVIDK